MKKSPDINLKEFDKIKEQNFLDRLDFIRRYAAWQKKVSNKRWSSSQKKIVDN